MYRDKEVVDGSKRQCVCGSIFTMMDYPPGYFHLKRDVKRGSGVNTCPKCELQKLREALDMTKSERQAMELQEDITLLTAGRITTERHKKNAQHVYGGTR